MKHFKHVIVGDGMTMASATSGIRDAGEHGSLAIGGGLDARLEVIEDLQKQFRKGVVYYSKQGLVHGVLLWNTWNRVETARELIMGKQRLSRSSLRVNRNTLGRPRLHKRCFASSTQCGSSSPVECSRTRRYRNMSVLSERRT